MKNDIWKLLLITKNRAAEVTGRPAASLCEVDSAIDLIQQAHSGYAELLNSDNYLEVQIRNEMRYCARIESDLIEARIHLKSMGVM